MLHAFVVVFTRPEERAHSEGDDSAAAPHRGSAPDSKTRQTDLDCLRLHCSCKREKEFLPSQPGPR